MQAAIAESLAAVAEKKADEDGDEKKGEAEEDIGEGDKKQLEQKSEESKEEKPTESAILKMFGGWKKKLYDENPVLAPEPKNDEPKEDEAEEQIKPRKPKAEVVENDPPPAPAVSPEVLLSETTLISLEIIRRLDQYPMPPIPKGFIFENTQSIYKLKLLDFMDKILNMSAV